jgi:hypothetical protein
MRRALVAALLALALPPALAQDFAASATPPRYELEARPGTVVRQVLTLGNESNLAASYIVRTNDWDLNDAGGPVFFDELRPASCRPWVRIERREVRLKPLEQRRYRFEVHVPQDAPEGECRFALMVEQPPDVAAATGGAGNVRFPIQGRLGVIVYLRVGSAAPRLELEGVRTETVNAQKVPVAVFRNAGNAHGRPAGVLEAVDADRRSLELTVSPSPVLPGRTRAVPIWPQAAQESDKPPALRYPLTLKGKIEWDGGSRDIDLTLR